MNTAANTNAASATATTEIANTPKLVVTRNVGESMKWGGQATTWSFRVEGPNYNCSRTIEAYLGYVSSSDGSNMESAVRDLLSAWGVPSVSDMGGIASCGRDREGLYVRHEDPTEVFATTITLEQALDLTSCLFETRKGLAAAYHDAWATWVESNRRCYLGTTTQGDVERFTERLGRSEGKALDTINATLDAVGEIFAAAFGYKQYPAVSSEGMFRLLQKRRGN